MTETPAEPQPSQIRSACITVVEIDERRLFISGHYRSDVNGVIEMYRFNFEQPPLTDATDLQMWAQMVAARVCDAL